MPEDPQLAIDALDITPDPRILIALTRTPLAPLDAICELIDNGLDAFFDAQVKGTPIPHPIVVVSLPGAAEVQRGEGLIRVQDNGRGLDPGHVANAIRAGYTSKNPFDTLGLFGMGFNIATGKLGQVTRLLTARAEDDDALEVTIDLVKLVRSGNFRVPARRVAKPEGFEHGTVVEVSGWWPDGDPNSGFIVKLAGMPKQFVREQLGRRYATLLRADQTERVRLLVNADSSKPYEHCVWDALRFVERQGWGRISARYEVDDVVGVSRRCPRGWRAAG